MSLTALLPVHCRAGREQPGLPLLIHQYSVRCRISRYYRAAGLHSASNAGSTNNLYRFQYALHNLTVVHFSNASCHPEIGQTPPIMGLTSRRPLASKAITRSPHGPVMTKATLQRNIFCTSGSSEAQRLRPPTHFGNMPVGAHEFQRAIFNVMLVPAASITQSAPSPSRCFAQAEASPAITSQPYCLAIFSR